MNALGRIGIRSFLEEAVVYIHTPATSLVYALKRSRSMP